MAISIRHRAEHHHRQVSRRRRAWVAGAVVVATIGVGMLVSRTSLLHARSIRVSGHVGLTRAEVVARSGLDRDTNVLWLDEEAAERALESDARIASASVSVHFPATIQIQITEREPVAVALGAHGPTLIAADGTTVGSVERASESRGLPHIQLAAPGVVDGPAPGVEGAAAALGSMSPVLRQDVVRVAVLLDGTLELWLRSGPRVAFGAPERVAPKSKVIAEALAWARAEGERILTLSVIAPSAPAATLAP